MPKNAVFLGKRHDNKILKVQLTLLRNYVFIAQAPKYIPPPPSPDSGPNAFCRGGGGGGVYSEAPRCRNFISPPPFTHPPPLEGYFQGWGMGCFKFGPVWIALQTLIFLAFFLCVFFFLVFFVARNFRGELKGTN